MLRRVDDCEYRTDLHRRAGRGAASCGLVERRFPGGPGPVPVPRETCERCCRSAPPGPDRLNDVLASAIYLRAVRIQAGPSAGGSRAAEVSRARDEAEPGLRVAWSTPNGPRWQGPVYNLRSAEEVIDPAVDADTFAGHLLLGEAFAYLRYGDGEWFSILGEVGRNGDGHDYLPDTLGRELRETIAHAAGLGPRGGRFYMGLHAGVMQPAIRRYLVENEVAYRVRWVSDNLFALGLHHFSTLRFFQAVRDYRGTKVLVANDSLAPVAEGLGLRHVVVPRVDCHREVGRIEREARFRGPGLLICCAGMSSECLICRLHRRNPRASYVDCGHVFDALVGNYTREYTQGDWGGVRDFLAEHYAPVVFGGPVAPGAGG